MTNRTKILALATVGVVATSLAFAQTHANAFFGGLRSADGSFAQRFAQRFNIDESEVKTFMDELHAEKKAEHEADKDAKLDQLVTDGILTEEQKEAYKTKMEEFRSFMEENRPAPEDFASLTEEERQAQMEEHKTKMDEHRAEMEAWATEQGIDLEAVRKDLMPEGHKGRHGMRPGMRGEDRGPRPDFYFEQDEESPDDTI